MNPPRSWTPPQLVAIRHQTGELLVSAAAGSGKTAVLAERCARLVCETGCGVDRLLVLTFTDAAAAEMKGRIAAALREKLRRLESTGADPHVRRWLHRQAAIVDRAAISTLHGFCARVLRQHFHDGNIDPAFDVLDEDEARLLRDDVLGDLLAHWHAPPPGPENPETARFAAFFEAYAEGRDAYCKDMILRVHNMLASVADPAAYLAGARRVYDQDASAVVQCYVREVAAERLRVLGLTARRAAERVLAAGVTGPMATALQGAVGRIATAEALLRDRGAAAWTAAAAELDDAFPKRLAPLRDADLEILKKQTYQRVKDEIAAAKKEFPANLAGAEQHLRSLAAPLDALLALVHDFTNHYAAAKRAQNRLDFNDLERLTHALLTQSPAATAAASEPPPAAELRERFDHLLVDEFQDINPLQAALLEALNPARRAAPDAGGFFLVGDVKQSIYGFRLADPHLFLERERIARAQVTSAAAAPAAYVALPHNFRSRPPLLTAMNAFFDKLLTPEVAEITYANGHALQPPPRSPSAQPEPTPATPSPPPIEMHLLALDAQPEETDPDDAPADPTTPTENLTAVEYEARLVADRIAALLAEGRPILLPNGASRPLQCRDIAILLRAVKTKAMIFARALARRGIAVHADLSAGYFDTPEVRDALALLQILDNPQQDIPLATALLGPYGRFSHDDLARIRLAFDRTVIPFAEAVTRYAQEAPPESAPAPAASATAPLAERLDAFFEKLARWRALFRTHPLHEVLAAILSESRIFPYLSGLDAGAQRVANLQALHQRALKFSSFRKQGLHRFLRFIDKLRDTDGDVGEAPVLSEASDVVRIMSIHKSKGLEFPVVFVSGLGAPFKFSESCHGIYVNRDFHIGLDCIDTHRNIAFPSLAALRIIESTKRTARAEELRLLYVAMTRARDRLILTGHIRSAEHLADIRALWKDHAGPLPEDVLLKARTPLDWLLPAAAAASELPQHWPADPPTPSPQLTITLHPPRQALPPNQGAPNSVFHIPNSATPPNSAFRIPHSAFIDRLVHRITAPYPHAAAAHQPAVLSVSQIKSQHPSPAADDPDAILAIPVVLPPRLPMPKTPATPADAARAALARARGTATHRLLERLDFTHCDHPDCLPAEIERLLAARQLTPEETKLADREGVAWFLSTPIAQRAADFARRRAAHEPGIHLRREIPFTWAAPLDPVAPPSDPADFPTIRGIIDLLLVDTRARTAELIDYKTDSLHTWQSALPNYQRQMRHYLRAASAILTFPVSTATLCFLTPHEIRDVPLEDAAASSTS